MSFTSADPLQRRGEGVTHGDSWKTMEQQAEGYRFTRYAAANNLTQAARVLLPVLQLLGVLVSSTLDPVSG